MPYDSVEVISQICQFCQKLKKCNNNFKILYVKVIDLEILFIAGLYMFYIKI